jgi:uncharacterized protein (TIRG00374 family)
MSQSKGLIAFFKQHQKLVMNVARVVVTALGVTLVLTQIRPRELWEGLLLADWRRVATVLLIFQLGILIRSVRWQALLGALGDRPRLLRLVGLYYAGAFFNTFLPTGFGGDVVRTIEIGQDTSTNTALATVVLDRMSGLIVLFAIALVTIVGGAVPMPTNIILMATALSIVGITGWVLLVHTPVVERIVRWLAERIHGIGLGHVADFATTLREIDRQAVWKAIAASLLFNLLLITCYWLMARAFSITLPWITFAVIVPLNSVLLLLPSIQGVGVREPTLMFLLGSVGVDGGHAVAFALGVYMQTLSTGLVGAIYYAIYSLTSVGRRQKAEAALEASTEATGPQIDNT